MNRIDKKFKELKNKDEKALITYITAGDPDLDVTEKLVLTMVNSGSDIVELGVPFSDPLADGPTIQAASQRALKRGTSLEKIFGLVSRIRKKTDIPLILMTYNNPVNKYGYKRFISECSSTGVDGIIIPDLIPEEAGKLISQAGREGVDVIFLAAPTSSLARKKFIAEKSTGFLYYVSLKGTTGEKKELSKSISDELSEIKKLIKIPLACGFGISTPEQAKQVSSNADGVIVGSAIVRIIERFKKTTKMYEEVSRFVSSLKKVMR